MAWVRSQITWGNRKSNKGISPLVRIVTATDDLERTDSNRQDYRSACPVTSGTSMRVRDLARYYRSVNCVAHLGIRLRNSTRSARSFVFASRVGRCLRLRIRGMAAQSTLGAVQTASRLTCANRIGNHTSTPRTKTADRGDRSRCGALYSGGRRRSYLDWG